MKKQFNFLIVVCFITSVSFIHCMKRPREEDSNFSNKKTLTEKEKIQQEIASNFFKDFKNITKKKLKGFPDSISQIKRNFGVYESFGTFKEIEQSPGLYIQILNPYLDRLNNNFTDEQSIKKIKEEIANDLRVALNKEIFFSKKQKSNIPIYVAGNKNISTNISLTTEDRNIVNAINLINYGFGTYTTDQDQASVNEFLRLKKIKENNPLFASEEARKYVASNFRKQALQYHPDQVRQKNNNLAPEGLSILVKDAEEKFKKINGDYARIQQYFNFK